MTAYVLPDVHSVERCFRRSKKFLDQLVKLVGELLNPLAAMLDKGSDMAVYLRRT